ncbi:beta-ketoacyl-ACP synthase III [Robiginitomaculum antarcticum]|uniref:beta-ketoacyl-ACP synthase III n=1 Tax=Robiginitomaculum antarcticum TaxID=437507 RepID=UPI00036D32D3|nr:beta-ketoacyl-ACP synthase III [Robiginitomaculum antarcticum]
MVLRAILAGTGQYLPEKILSNADMSQFVETSDEWIVARTGITQRHQAAEGEFTSDLATAAARNALKDADVNIEDIDLIIVATTTPDYTFPATATIVQKNLGMTHGAAFDLQAVCSGFIYGVNVVDAMIRAGAARNVLLVGAETFTRILDFTDRTTCVLFGDGAGAVVMSAKEVDEDGPGVLASFIRSDGRHKDLLHVDGGPSSTGTVGHVRMIGNQVFKRAVNDIADAMTQCAAKVDMPIEDIDWFVPHQANQRILNGVAKKLAINPDSVISTVARHANTSAASVPLALHTAIADGRIKRGDTVMLEAFGGGFTWGAALLRY